jgi:FlaG/FlaF family flagellin (archaellin)
MLLRAVNDKRGISIVIGYVLLIAISIVMSVVVYQWLKTYVPTDSIECDDGTSLFINDVSYNCATGRLDITVKNNGKFSINGYYVHVSNKAGEELATIDISKKIFEGGSVYGATNSIMFSEGKENFLAPESSIVSAFNVADYSTGLVKIEIIPTRIQEIDNKKRLVSCSGAKIKQDLECNYYYNSAVG